MSNIHDKAEQRMAYLDQAALAALPAVVKVSRGAEPRGSDGDWEGMVARRAYEIAMAMWEEREVREIDVENDIRREEKHQALRRIGAPVNEG